MYNISDLNSLKRLRQWEYDDHVMLEWCCIEPCKDDIITVELSNRWEEYLISLQVGKKTICSVHLMHFAHTKKAKAINYAIYSVNILSTFEHENMK